MKRGAARVGSQAPQIVTLTNEKGDLIKAIISVGNEEQVERRVSSYEGLVATGVVQALEKLTERNEALTVALRY